MPKDVIDNLLAAQQQLAYARNRITHDSPAWDDITHAMSSIADATMNAAEQFEMGPRNMHAGEDRSNALLFWRRVSSELPPAPLGYWSDRVLVYTKYPDGKSSITVDSYYHAESGNGFWNHHRYGVTARPTHWMPFPEPPR